MAHIHSNILHLIISVSISIITNSRCVLKFSQKQKTRIIHVHATRFGAKLDHQQKINNSETHANKCMKFLVTLFNTISFDALKNSISLYVPHSTWSNHPSSCIYIKKLMMYSFTLAFQIPIKKNIFFYENIKTGTKI